MNVPKNNITEEVAHFIFKLSYADLPNEAIRIAKRCILDGIGLILAGSSQKCTEIIRKHCLEIGNIKEATAFGKESISLPATLAAMINGTAGHAMDWDDTQLSVTPDRMYGLLTHPTMPPLVACVAISEKLGKVTSREFLTAFLSGFEVECKIAEAISPDHYKKGFHTSGTIGSFGATAAAGKLIGLDAVQLRSAIGIAASMSAGIRANFGTMMKPLHVGRASQNGVTAALLAKDGFEADPDALDGRWGYFQIFGGGLDPEKISGCLGNPHTITDPGVSIKPYPCGVLTHPSMDAILSLVLQHDLKPEDIDSVVLYAGSNILNPIRYATASNELEAKFCMPFLLSSMILSRKAGTREFTSEFVNAPSTQSMMGKIRTEFDKDIEAKGWDKIRSRVEIKLLNGKILVREADEHYRGGPDNPLTDEQLQEKFTDCTEALLTPSRRDEIFETMKNFETIKDIRNFLSLVTP